MKVGKFTLGGKNAFFKKPDVNSYYYFTYGNIHKVALLGMFGAILGYGGYHQLKSNETMQNKKVLLDDVSYPEFYDRLKDIKLSVVPNYKGGIIPKKVQTFNNSVGYASKEQGGNLIIKEQWLENPSWDIYILLDCDESIKIMEYIMNQKCVYIPYLGKNDHIADISNVVIIEGKEVNVNKIDSLFPRRHIELKDYMEEDDECEEDTWNDFKYEEQLPIGLDGKTNLYIYDSFIFTNMMVRHDEQLLIYHVENKSIAFY